MRASGNAALVLLQDAAAGHDMQLYLTGHTLSLAQWLTAVLDACKTGGKIDDAIVRAWVETKARDQ